MPDTKEPELHLDIKTYEDKLSMVLSGEAMPEWVKNLEEKYQIIYKKRALQSLVTDFRSAYISTGPIAERRAKMTLAVLQNALGQNPELKRLEERPREAWSLDNDFPLFKKAVVSQIQETIRADFQTLCEKIRQAIQKEQQLQEEGYMRDGKHIGAFNEHLPDILALVTDTEYALYLSPQHRAIYLALQTYHRNLSQRQALYHSPKTIADGTEAKILADWAAAVTEMKAAITSQETQVIDMTPIETILSDVQLQSALNDWMLSSAEERIAAATPLQKFAQEYVLEPYLQMQADALQQHWEQTRTDRVGKIEQQMTQRIAAESRQAAVDQFDIAQPGGDGWFSICTSKGVWIHAQIELTGRVNISIKDFDKKSLLRSSREHYEIQKDTIRHALDFLDYLSGHSLSGVPLVISSKVASKDPKTVHLFKQELESFSQRHQSKVEKSFDEVAEKISPRTSPS